MIKVYLLTILVLFSTGAKATSILSLKECGQGRDVNYTGAHTHDEREFTRSEVTMENKT